MRRKVLLSLKYFKSTANNFTVDFWIKIYGLKPFPEFWRHEHQLMLSHYLFIMISVIEVCYGGQLRYVSQWHASEELDLSLMELQTPDEPPLHPFRQRVILSHIQTLDRYLCLWQNIVLYSIHMLILCWSIYALVSRFTSGVSRIQIFHHHKCLFMYYT